MCDQALRSKPPALEPQQLQVHGELAVGLAHDLKNLLAVIYTAASSLRRRASALDDGLHRTVEHIVLAADDAGRLIAGLVEVGRAPEPPERLELAPLVTATVDLLRRSVCRGVGVSLVVDDTLAIDGSAIALRRVLINACLNARDALPELGGIIQIVAVGLELDAGTAGALALAPGRYVELLIRDNGHGMDAATLHRAFEPFYSTRTGRHAGLGLTSIAAVAQAHGGTVDLRSTPGQGTELRIFLPRP